MSTHASPAQRYAAFRRQQAQDGPALTEFQALYDFTFDDFQRRACQALNAGHGVLVAAPTGSGKTLAAFLAAIDTLVRQGVEGELPDETQVVYVSPLDLDDSMGGDVEDSLDGSDQT